MSRRRTIRISSFIVVGLAVLIGFAVTGTRQREEYKNQLEISYQQSLNELSECLDKVNSDLNKTLYSNSSKEMTQLSRDLFAQCSVAKNAVSRLPISQLELGNTYKFLSQAGDYARYIGAKAEAGQRITKQEHENLHSLLKYAQRFSDATEEMVRTVTNGARITDGAVKNDGTAVVMPLNNAFSEGAKAFESFPTLLYDGPFSEQVLRKKSKLVSAAPVTTRQEAGIAAQRALNVSKNRIRYETDEKSKLPCFTFRSGRYTVSVTRQGGYIKSILYSGLVTGAELTEEEAIRKAKAYLSGIGYTDMRESYYATDSNICTVNFAYAKDDVYCYSDLIKVGVSLENGKVLTLDAATYLTNHTERKPFQAKITAKEAEERLSPYLTVNGVKKCVIPKDNGTEKQCYEFAVTSKDTGEDALIYVNAATGEEEDIMLLLYTDNGTLVK